MRWLLLVLLCGGIGYALEATAQVPADFELVVVVGDRGPAFDAPVTSLHISAAGTVQYQTYSGLTRVDSLELTLTAAQLQAIWNAILSGDFFALDSTYIDTSVAGGTYVSLFVRANGQEHLVQAHMQSVEVLDGIIAAINDQLPEAARLSYDLSVESIPGPQVDVCDRVGKQTVIPPKPVSTKEKLSAAVTFTYEKTFPSIAQGTHTGTVIGYRHSLREAIKKGFVRLTGKGGYWGDEVSISVDNSNTSKTKKDTIHIQLFIEFYGKWASAANVRRIKKAIEERWKGQTSDGKYIKTEVIVRRDSTRETPPNTAGYHQIKLGQRLRSYVVQGSAGPNKGVMSGQWATEGEEGDDLEAMYAHEAGHLMGLADEYTDYIKTADGKWRPQSGGAALTSTQLANLLKQRNSGADAYSNAEIKNWLDAQATGWAISVSNAGKKGSLMAELKGRVQRGHLDWLAQQAGVIVVVTPGNVLVNKEGHKQNLVITRRRDLFVKSGEKRTFEGLWVACIDAHKAPPGWQQRFDVAPPLSEWVGIEAAALLQQLVDYLDATDQYCASNYTSQEAIWRLTDNENVQDEAVQALLAAAGIQVGARVLDFPRLSNPNPDTSERVVVPTQLFVARAARIVGQLSQQAAISLTVMGPSLEGLSLQATWKLLRVPPGSEAVLTAGSKRALPSTLGDTLTATATLTPDKVGFYTVGYQFALTTTAGDTLKRGEDSTFVVVRGTATETFENGLPSWGPPFYWERGGDAPWTVDDADAFTGTRAAHSGTITHGQQSVLQTTVTLPADGVIQFALRVSSEENYDYLRFYIDDQEQESWSGDVPWRWVAFEIPAGTHTVRWVYEKDWSVSEGADRAWIDDVIFPKDAIFTAAEPAPDLPAAFSLFPVYPNPFRTEAVVRYALPRPSTVTVAVYDVLGRRVMTLVAPQPQPAGFYEVRFDGRRLPGGLYFVTMETDAFRATRTVLLLH